MPRRIRNRWDIMVSFSDYSFGVKSHDDVEITPVHVAEALEEMATRIREELQRQAAAPAQVPPQQVPNA